MPHPAQTVSVPALHARGMGVTRVVVALLAAPDAPTGATAG
jgi:hypothetical protein